MSALISVGRTIVFLACLWLSGELRAAQPAAGTEFTLEVRLLWGTNEETSPDPSHKKVDTEFTKWLISNRYKWKNYFEVKSETVKIPVGAPKTVALSQGNSVEIKNVDGKRIEAKLIGRGKEVTKVAKPVFPKGERLVIAGQDKNDYGWFVVIKNVAGK